MSDEDQKVSDEYRARMHALALTVDELFNGSAKGHERKTCFVLLVAPFDDESRVNYLSNGERRSIVTLMKELIARFEGQPEMEGRA